MYLCLARPNRHPYVHSGNNAITYVNVATRRVTTTQSSAPLNFVYIQDPTKNPEPLQANIDAARVNTFYVANMVHDISYQYGFTEAAFNFQNNNFGKGGAGNDRVEVSVQDRSGVNDGGSPLAHRCTISEINVSLNVTAYFFTPPE